MTYQTDAKPEAPAGAVRAYRPEIADVMPVSQVYFVLGMTSRLVKIGYAKDAWKRLSSMQTGCPEELRMLGAIDTYLPERLERELHERFAALRVRGEWFKLSDELVDYAVQHGGDAWEEDA